MKKITISFLVLFLLFGSFTLEFPSVEASNKTHVKEKQALNYAKKFLKENVVTKNDISVTFKANIYDIDDSILGYYFSYIEEGGDNGYIIISASKERTPIIEFGEGDLGYDFSKELD